MPVIDSVIANSSSTLDAINKDILLNTVTNLVITFNENMNQNNGNVEIYTSGDGEWYDQIDSGTQVENTNMLISWRWGHFGPKNTDLPPC